MSETDRDGLRSGSLGERCIHLCVDMQNFFDGGTGALVQHDPGGALPADAVKLVPSLGRLVPPAEVLDKTVYSPWVGTDLHERLRARRADALIITGTETDVCVLGAVLGAVDLGYRVVRGAHGRDLQFVGHHARRAADLVPRALRRPGGDGLDRRDPGRLGVTAGARLGASGGRRGACPGACPGRGRPGACPAPPDAPPRRL